MMTVQTVGEESQYRAHCTECGIGLNWWADAQGLADADGYAASHNTAHAK